MPLEHAILAFVQFRPMTGYDLKKHFDDSVTHFWSATQSHIYRSLNRMSEEGWLRMTHVEQEGRPDRKVYHITPEGSQELHRWLTTPLPLGDVREDWLVQLFFAHQLSNPEIVALLEARAEAIRARIAHYRDEVQGNIERNYEQVGVERARDLWQLTLEYGIAMSEAELRWLEQAIERARALPPLPNVPPPLVGGG